MGESDGDGDADADAYADADADENNSTDDDDDDDDADASASTFKSFTFDDLRRLAIGTIFYGQISSLQVWQILVSILPELNNNDGAAGEGGAADGNADTCSSPWSEYCPPKQIS